MGEISVTPPLGIGDFFGDIFGTQRACGNPDIHQLDQKERLWDTSKLGRFA